MSHSAWYWWVMFLLLSAWWLWPETLKPWTGSWIRKQVAVVVVIAVLLVLLERAHVI